MPQAILKPANSTNYQGKPLKGIAFSQQTPNNPQTSDLYALQTRGCQIIRIEASPNMTGNDAYTIHNRMKMQTVLLLGRHLLPNITTKQWQSQGSDFTNVLSMWEHILTELIPLWISKAPVEYMEIWNEPNTNLDNRSGTGLPSNNFAKLYRTAYSVIKRLSPSTQVISGGLFSHSTSGAEYLAKVRQADSSLPIELTGWHPYLDSGGGLQTNNVTKFIEELHVVAKTPLFITEAGWDTTVVSQETQAENINKLYTTCVESKHIRGVLIFTFEDVPQSKPPLHFGIHGKTAWDIFKLL